MPPCGHTYGDEAPCPQCPPDDHRLAEPSGAVEEVEVTPVSPEPPDDPNIFFESVPSIRRNSWRHGWAEGYRAAVCASREAPTCEHCGLPLTCSSERAERIHGLEQMHAEALTRAEQAGALVTQQAAQIQTLRAAITRAQQRQRLMSCSCDHILDDLVSDAGAS